MNVDAGELSILLLLGHSAGSDTIHLGTLINKLSLCVGITETPLITFFFKSDLSNRNFSASIGDKVSYFAALIKCLLAMPRMKLK